MSPARPDAMRRSLRLRAWTDHGVTLLCLLAALAVVTPLLLIVAHLVREGIGGLRPGFFVHLPKPVGEPGGGMANAVVGTLVLNALGAAFAIPLGVGAGLYLSEIGRGRLATLVRLTTDVLAGVPSIVVGVAVFGLLVVPMGRFSALAGGLALGILMLPTIVRSTEEVVRLVPQSYRHAALALGAPRWKVIHQVVLPAARGGITTACLLAVARAAGETAPLLFTALGNRFWSVRLDQPIASLPVMIFDYARSPYPDWNAQAWTGALTLILVVAAFSAAMRVVARR